MFDVNLSYEGHTVNADGMMVSGNYFQVLQVQPALGRLFDPNDDRLVGERLVRASGSRARSVWAKARRRCSTS
jgi:hypothetical protein